MSIDNLTAELAVAFQRFGEALQTKQKKTDDTISGLPISRFGDSTKLPVDIFGAFEGASDNAIDSRYVAMLIEEDGTAVWLRNGTDGAVNGIYYAYSKNAYSPGGLSYPQKSVRRYRPSYFPTGKYGRNVYRSNSPDVVWGRLNTDAGDFDDFFLSYTNGTMDDAVHQGVTFALEDRPWAGYSTVGSITVFSNDTHIYFLMPVTVSGSVEIAVSRITIAAVKAGGVVTSWEKLTNWTVTSFSTTFAGATNIKIAGAQLNPDPATHPLVLNTGTDMTNLGGAVANALGYTLEADFNPANPNELRIRICADTYFAVVGTSNAIRPFLSLSYVANISTKVVTIDPGKTGPAILTRVNDAPVLTGDFYTYTMTQLYGTNTRNTAYSQFYDKRSKLIFAHIDDSGVDGSKNFFRFVPGLPNGSYYDNLLHTVALGTRFVVTYFPAYGSALGGVIYGPTFVGLDRLLVHSRGRNAAGETMAGLVMVDLGANGYTYGSVVVPGGINGFAPKNNRRFLNEAGLPNDQMYYSQLISQYDGSTVKVTGGYFTEGASLTRPYQLNRNLGLVDSSKPTTTITQACLDNVKALMLSSLGIPNDSSITALISVVVPISDVSPFAVLFWLNKTTKVSYVAGANLAITGGSLNGTITAMTISNVSAAIQVFTGVLSIQTYASTGTSTTGGVSLYKTPEGWIVSMTLKYQQSISGNTNAISLQFFTPQNGNHEWSTMKRLITNYGSLMITYGSVPGVGFGLYRQQAPYSDNMTKLRFDPYGTTKADFIAETLKTPFVVAGQTLASGWNVFFTSATACHLNGVEGVLPPTNVDLTTIAANPANKTFFVYALLNASSFSYDITLEEYVDSNVRMYLGRIVTDATKITDISVDKVVRLENYRLNTKARGGSIPVTTGKPMTQIGSTDTWDLTS